MNGFSQRPRAPRAKQWLFSEQDTSCLLLTAAGRKNFVWWVCVCSSGLLQRNCWKGKTQTSFAALNQKLLPSHPQTAQTQVWAGPGSPWRKGSLHTWSHNSLSIDKLGHHCKGGAQKWENRVIHKLETSREEVTFQEQKLHFSRTLWFLPHSALRVHETAYDRKHSYSN